MMSSSCRSIPTEDRISNMPDSILCHILSFHPTKFAATTSVLSKRWKLVWLSVLTLDFDQGTFKDFNSFREFVYAFMFSLRDKKISIHSFTLKCGISSHFNQKEFNRIFKFVMQRGVQNLNFDMSNKKRRIKLPHCIFNLKTLEVLKLGNINMRDFDQVDFPRLKTLHLDKVSFTSPEYFVKFLYGCPNLEDLNTKSFIYPSNPSQYDPIKNLNPLPNLVKVMILSNMDNVMTLFCKAKILHVEQRGSMACCTSTTLPMFYNLTHMELIFHHRFCESWEWSILGMLPYIPNLQHFIIQDLEYRKMFCKGYCWKHPATVPECLSTKLKICCIRTYTGTEHEFEFAKYIMQHSKVLETMKIQSTCLKKDQMLLKLYSCTRGSPTCKLFVD